MSRVAFIPTEFQKQRTKELFEEGYGARYIADQVGITRENVKRIYIILGLSNAGKKKQYELYTRNKKCKKCGGDGPFAPQKRTCKKCKQEEAKARRNQPINRVFDAFKQKFGNCLYRNGIKFKTKYIPFSKKEFISHFSKLFTDWMTWNNYYGHGNSPKWNNDNPNTWSWRIIHIIPKKQLQYTSIEDENFKKYWSLSNLNVCPNSDYKELARRRREKKMKNPVNFMRAIISGQIRAYLKHNKIDKNGQSCFKYLPYTPKELRAHIQNQFEPWMTWGNHGNYKVEDWNDDDPATWKWQLDHIKPHSTFEYSSMKDQAFQDAWALSNLRPYSAKWNAIDGGRRTRH
jgi:hypothetical protein